MSYRMTVGGEFILDRPLTTEGRATLQKFAQERHDDERRYPGYPWCQWVPNADGTAIVYTEDEISGYHLEEWLEYIIKTFLVPWHHTLNGRVNYFGEEPGEDIGAIFVKDNVVRVVEAEIIIRDPFADDRSLE